MSEEKEMVTPQEMAETEPQKSLPIRFFQKSLAYFLILCLIVLLLGFIFFLGLALWQGIIWLWPF